MDCRHLKKDKDASKDVESRKISEEKGTSTIATSEEELLLISEHICVNLANDLCTWIVDSGVSFHLTPKRECLTSYTTGDYNYVKMGNEDASKIIGVGKVCLPTSTSCRSLLNDVRHVPDIS